MVGRFKLDKQVEHLVHGPHGPRRRLVDLVDDHDDGQGKRQRLLEHEIRLRHGAFLRVNEQKRAVGHLEHALHLAAEIGVARGVDDVDEVAPVFERPVFGGNGDAALALEVHGIHEAFRDNLVVAEHAALFEKLVDERGFAVVHVGDDGDVADITLAHVIILAWLTICTIC